jgi:DNA repair protein RadC
MNAIPEFSFVTPSYAVREVRISVVNEVASTTESGNRAEDIVRLFRETISKASWFDADKECFVVVHLNMKNRVKGFTLVSLGSLNSTFAAPREVFRAAIVAGAAMIVCIHNHPSGDPAPSNADMKVTRDLREAAKIIEIGLLDHIIIGDAKADPRGVGYYSMREAGIV